MGESDISVRQKSPPDPFAVKDCALISLATGKKAQNLREFWHVLCDAPRASVYYHFWGGLLAPRFEEREFNNDFASWARHGLHDHPLAERLAVVDPTEYPDLEDLRREILEIAEQRLEEGDHVPWAKNNHKFEFLLSKIVVFDTKLRFETPEQLAEKIDLFPLGGFFYHFIDSRRRPPDKVDDFSAWLGGFGKDYEKLRSELAAVDPYFTTLHKMREKVSRIFKGYFAGGGNVA